METDQWAWNASLRVAVVHSFYTAKQPSGENTVVTQQVDALRRAGYSVELFARHTDHEQARTRLYPVKAAATVATGHGPHPIGDLTEYRPDIVHVHNLFPNFGRSWVPRWSGPLVATLHNFRPLCSAGTFFRDGHVCTECLDAHSSRPAVQHGCYRDNRLATVPVAMGQKFADDPVLQRADHLIVLSDLAKELYAKAGVPVERMSVMSNFLDEPGDVGPGGFDWVFVGRLSPEKGVLEMVREWPESQPLRIVGTGPLQEEVERAAAGKSVRLLGQLSPAEVREQLRTARGLVFPSRCFEGFPMTYLEALSAGTPVLAWEPNSVAGMVQRDGTGQVVEEPLSQALAQATTTFPSLRQHCRETFDRQYAEAAWVRRLRAVYDQAMLPFHRSALSGD